VEARRGSITSQGRSGAEDCERLVLVLGRMAEGPASLLDLSELLDLNKSSITTSVSSVQQVWSASTSDPANKQPTESAPRQSPRQPASCTSI